MAASRKEDEMIGPDEFKELQGDMNSFRVYEISFTGIRRELLADVEPKIHEMPVDI